MKPSEYFNKKVLGTIRVLSPWSPEGNHESYEVIDEVALGSSGSPAYVADQWYKEDRREPLHIPAMFVVSFTPAP